MLPNCQSQTRGNKKVLIGLSQDFDWLKFETGSTSSRDHFNSYVLISRRKLCCRFQMLVLSILHKVPWDLCEAGKWSAVQTVSLNQLTLMLERSRSHKKFTNICEDVSLIFIKCKITRKHNILIALGFFSSFHLSK